jgi:hypothetical protein
MGTNAERSPLLQRVAALSPASKQRIMTAAGVPRIVEENTRPPRAHHDWGFARLPSLDHFYKVRREQQRSPIFFM